MRRMALSGVQPNQLSALLLIDTLGKGVGVQAAAENGVCSCMQACTLKSSFLVRSAGSGLLEVLRGEIKNSTSS